MTMDNLFTHFSYLFFHSFPVVANAMYTFHSFNIPYPQERFWLNQCWRSINDKFVLDQWCNVFVARIPSLNEKEGKLDSVSFESVCFPGYFMRQKNFHFLLQKRDGSDVFGECNHQMQ